jgi:hypothetical protein
VDEGSPLSADDVQTIMESLFDIRAGVTLLVAELIGEDEEDGPGEEEET